MTNTERWGGLRLEPYDPDADDADNDGIVQEQTPWERPKGTTLVDSANRPIRKGATADARDPRMRVMRDGKEVQYTPTYGGQGFAPAAKPSKPTSLAQRGAPSLRERGVLPLKDTVGSLSEPPEQSSPARDTTPPKQAVRGDNRMSFRRNPMGLSPKAAPDAVLASKASAEALDVTPQFLEELDQLDSNLRNVSKIGFLGSAISKFRRHTDESKFTPSKKGQAVLDDVMNVGKKLRQEVQRLTPSDVAERQKRFLTDRANYIEQAKVVNPLIDETINALDAVTERLSGIPGRLYKQATDEEREDIVAYARATIPGFSERFDRIQQWRSEEDRLMEEAHAIRKSMAPIYRAVISKVRELGTKGTPLDIQYDNDDSLVEDSVNTAMRVIPSDWLDAIRDRGLHVGLDRRGSYSPNGPDGRDHMLLDDLMHDSAVHELMHGAEALPEIRALEHLFAWSRISDDEPLVEERPGEFAYDDKFQIRYMGRLYKDGRFWGDVNNSFEILAMGAEKMFGTQDRDIGFSALDDDYLDFMLGTFAVAGRSRPPHQVHQRNKREVESQETTTSATRAAAGQRKPPRKRGSMSVSNSPREVSEQTAQPSPTPRGSVIGRSRTSEEMVAAAEQILDEIEKAGGTFTPTRTMTPEERNAFIQEQRPPGDASMPYSVRAAGTVAEWTELHERQIASLERSIAKTQELIKQYPNEEAFKQDLERSEALLAFLRERSPEEVMQFVADRIRAGLQDEETRVAVNIPEERWQQMLSDNGVYRTTHEVKSNHSSAEFRRRYETLLGLPQDAPASIRPASGYVVFGDKRRAVRRALRARWAAVIERRGLDDTAWNPEHTEQARAELAGLAGLYGDIQVTLRPEVMRRTRFGYGDSLVYSVDAAPMHEPTDEELLRAIAASTGGNQQGTNSPDTYAAVLNLLLAGDGLETLSPGNSDLIGSEKGIALRRLGVQYVEALTFGSFDLADVEEIAIPISMAERRRLFPPDVSPADRVRRIIPMLADDDPDYDSARLLRLASQLDGMTPQQVEQFLPEFEARMQALEKFTHQRQIKTQIHKLNPDITVVFPSDSYPDTFTKLSAESRAKYGTEDPYVAMRGRLLDALESLPKTSTGSQGSPRGEMEDAPVAPLITPRGSVIGKARSTAEIEVNNEAITARIKQAGGFFRPSEITPDERRDWIKTQTDFADEIVQVVDDNQVVPRKDRGIMRIQIKEPDTRKELADLVGPTRREIERQLEYKRQGAEFARRDIAEGKNSQQVLAVHEEHIRRLESMIEYLDSTSPDEIFDQIAQLVRSIVDDEDTAIAVDVPQERLTSILSDGVYRTVHDVQGDHSPAEAREHYEVAVGLPYSASSDVRPASGYIIPGSRRRWARNTAGDMAPWSERATSQYGDVQFVLNPAVRGRTKIASGDSLNASTDAAPMSNPTDEELVRSVISDIGGIRNTLAGEDSRDIFIRALLMLARPDLQADGYGYGLDWTNEKSYTEALIFGSFDMADVAAISYDPSPFNREQEVRNLVASGSKWGPTLLDDPSNRSFLTLLLLKEETDLGDAIEDELLADLSSLPSLGRAEVLKSMEQALQRHVVLERYTQTVRRIRELNPSIKIISPSYRLPTATDEEISRYGTDDILHIRRAQLREQIAALRETLKTYVYQPSTVTAEPRA